MNGPIKRPELIIWKWILKCFPAPETCASHSRTLRQHGIGGGEWLYVQPRGLCGGMKRASSSSGPAEGGAFENRASLKPCWVGAFERSSDRARATFPACQCGRYQESTGVTNSRSVDEATEDLLGSASRTRWVFFVSHPRPYLSTAAATPPKVKLARTDGHGLDGIFIRTLHGMRCCSRVRCAPRGRFI